MSVRKKERAFLVEDYMLRPSSLLVPSSGRWKSICPLWGFCLWRRSILLFPPLLPSPPLLSSPPLLTSHILSSPPLSSSPLCVSGDHSPVTGKQEGPIHLFFHTSSIPTSSMLFVVLQSLGESDRKGERERGRERGMVGKQRRQQGRKAETGGRFVCGANYDVCFVSP